MSVASPYHRTNRLYALDGDGGMWLSSTPAAPGAAAGGRAARRLVTVAAVRDLITEPDIIYVACGAGGLWRSHDSGRVVPAGRRHRPTRAAVAMTTDDQDLVLVAAGERLYR